MFYLLYLHTRIPFHIIRALILQYRYEILQYLLQYAFYLFQFEILCTFLRYPFLQNNANYLWIGPFLSFFANDLHIHFHRTYHRFYLKNQSIVVKLQNNHLLCYTISILLSSIHFYHLLYDLITYLTIF